jgi:tRNA nucleotidyltransferase (CCA-adding enzyme)
MKLFNRLTGKRMHTELILLFSEAEPLKVLRRMKQFDLLKFLHPELKATAETDRLFTGIGETLTWFKLLYLDITIDTWFVYFLGLLDRLKDKALDETLERLSIPVRTRERMRHARRRYREILAAFYKEPKLAPSRIYDLLATLDTESLLLMMAKAKQEKAKKYISLYLTRLRTIKVELSGDDLKKLGIPPGPRYKKILAELLDAKLDGLVRNRDEEIEFVRKGSGGK